MTPKDADPERFLAMIALRSAETIDPNKLSDSLTRLFPKNSSQISMSASETGNALVVQIGIHQIAIMMIGAPAPAGYFDYASRWSFGWPEAAEAMGAHSAHISIQNLTASDRFSSRIDQARGLAMVTCALVDLTSAIGVYWTNSETIIPAGQLADVRDTINRAEPIMQLWVGVRLFYGEDHPKNASIGVSTCGLSSFIGREIEIAPNLRNFAESANLVIDFSHYILSTGVVPRDHDTIGFDEQNRISVTHHESGMLNLPIIQLEY